MELIDIGANLSHDSFDGDRDQVIGRARDAGVVRMVVTGASAQGSRKALELARGMPSVLSATAGVHPHLASGWNDEVDALMHSLASEQEVVAVSNPVLQFVFPF